MLKRLVYFQLTTVLLTLESSHEEKMMPTLMTLNIEATKKANILEKEESSLLESTLIILKELIHQKLQSKRRDLHSFMKDCVLSLMSV